MTRLEQNPTVGLGGNEVFVAALALIVNFVAITLSATANSVFAITHLARMSHH